MRRLDSLANALPRSAQLAVYWCIPACFENLLVAAGVKGVTQTALVEAYCHKFGDDALYDRQKGQDVALPSDHPSLIAAAKRHSLKRACFAVFADVSEKLYSLNAQGIRLDIATGLGDQDDYYAAIRQSIDAGKPGILSASSGPGLFHMGVFVGYSGDVLEFFDPALVRMEKKSRGGFSFSSDLVVLARSASQTKAPDRN